MGSGPLTVRRRLRLLDALTSVLLGGAALALYLRTLAPTVLAGDAGEFQFAPYLLGVAHPTGYPLYLLLGWAWSHLVPLGDVAYRMNLFSAVCAALAAGLLVPTARALLRRSLPGLPPAAVRLAAAVTAALFAVTPTFWSQSVFAEVYPLHLLLVIALLWALLAWGERAEPRLLLLAAGCFGLGLAHHRTTLLLAPACLAYVACVDRRALVPGRTMLKALALALLPLALYLLIPLRAPHTPYLRQPLDAGRELVLYGNTWADFAAFVLGGPFGGSVDLSVDLGARLAMAWGFLRADLGWAGVGLAAAGVAALAWRRKWALLALTGLAFLALLAFNLVYTIGDIVVLYIPVVLLAALWAGVGLGALVQALARAVALPARAWAAALLPALALPAWLAAGHYAAVDRSRDTAARSGWEAILSEPLPAGAILVSNDRDEIMPLWYLQYVGDGAPRRPDLLGLFPLITPELPALGDVLDLALSTGRPAFLVKEMPGVEVKVRLEPEGRLWRALGLAAEAEPAWLLGAPLAGAVELVGYDRSPGAPAPGGTLRVGLVWQPLRPLPEPYHTFVHLLAADGGKAAQSDHQPGGVYYPATLWQPGERLRDEHVLSLPLDLPAGSYRLAAGMYALRGDGGFESLGEPVPLGEVEVR